MQEVGDRRWETGDGRQKMGDRRRGNRRLETGDRSQKKKTRKGLLSRANKN